MNFTNPEFHKSNCPINVPVFFPVDCKYKDHNCCWQCEQCHAVIHVMVEKDLVDDISYRNLTDYGLHQ